MLKKFEVVGFKNFKSPIVFDFADVRQYNFNKSCIKDNLLKTTIVYGKNSIGKSNLGLALFDITFHLVDRYKTPNLYDHYLTNDGLTKYADFIYTFKFGLDEVVYSYSKIDVGTLVNEKLVINNQTIFHYKSNGLDNEKLTIDEKYEEILPNFHFHDSGSSILRYIALNSILSPENPIIKLHHFVSNMLWFRSLEENRYIGYKDPVKKASDFYNFIFESDNLKKFQKLLTAAGIDKKLVSRANPEKTKSLYFEGSPLVPFFSVASNGTKALYTYFYWTRNLDISFLFIDEFDAFYHFELAELLVKELEDRDSQTVLTTHNTNLLSNNIMRPDCYFILSADGLTSVAKATNRELREGHNLEKLYVNGEFGG